MDLIWQEMTSRERLLASWTGSGYDHPPLCAWCFGFRAPPHLRWQRDGREVRHWYTLRLEHIHTLPQPWDLEDDFRRVRAWRSIGLDDLLDVSVPWGRDPRVSWRDAELPPAGAEAYPVLLREYDTPSGPLRHAVRRTGEDPGEGWVVQPPQVPLIEDFNIPRAVEHLVREPGQVAAVAHLYREPDRSQRRAFGERLRSVRAFAREQAVAVQAWSAFGMDAVVWFMGVEGAIFLALDQPDAFCRAVPDRDPGRCRPHRAGRGRSRRGPDRGTRLVFLHRPVVPGAAGPVSFSAYRRDVRDRPPPWQEVRLRDDHRSEPAGRAAHRGRGGRAVLRGPGAGRPSRGAGPRAVRRAHHPGGRAELHHAGG